MQSTAHLNYFFQNTYDFIYETLFLHHLNLIFGSHLDVKTFILICVINISEFSMILMIKRMPNVPMHIGFSLELLIRGT